MGRSLEGVLRRRDFISLATGAVVAAALLPSLPVPATTKIEFPAGTRWHLYMIHNRYTDDQLARLLVWTDGDNYDLTASDERDRPLAADRKWSCLGKLRWVVGRDGYYEHHIAAVGPRHV